MREKLVSGRNGSRLTKFLFTFPAILFLIVFMGYPIIFSVVISFTRYDGIHPASFIGLQNYIDAFTSKEFLEVFGNNLYLTLIGLPLATFVPLFVAVILFDGVRFGKIFKVIFLLPSIFSVVIVGTIFRAFFAYDGPVNLILQTMGREPVDWLASGATSIPVIVLAMVWAGFGVNMLIILAGMSSIPTEIYESAMLDGIGWLQKVFYITIPLIWDVLEFVVVMNIVTLFSSMFGYIYTMTDGGPGYKSSVLEYLLYVKGFRLNNIGYACCIAAVLFVLVFVLSRAAMFLFHRKDKRQ